MTDKEKLKLINVIIADAEEYNGYTGEAKAAFYEAALNAVSVITAFEVEKHG